MQNLASKYRPKTFEEVVGQQSAVRWLGGQVRNQTAKPVLLHGPSGLGKTSLGRIYAQGLFCESGSSSGSPCRACRQCVDFEKRRHPEYIELNCAREGSLENIKPVLKYLTIHPMFSGRRIVLFDEAQQMSPKAFDALLKLLEEPPPWVVFIIVTTAIDQLPEAIKSRCTVHELKPVGFELRVSLLKRICEAERIEYEGEGLALIAELSGSNLRELIVRLDQVIEDGGPVGEQEVRRLLN